MQTSVTSLCDNFKSLSASFSDQKDVEARRVWLAALQECFKALKNNPYSEECVHAAQTSIKAAASLFAEHAADDGHLNADMQILCQVTTFMNAAIDAWADSEGRLQASATLHACFRATGLGLAKVAAVLMAEPSLMKLLLLDSLQICQAFLDLAHTLLFSERWLGLCGREIFAEVSTQLRSLLKDSLLPAVCFIITNVPDDRVDEGFDGALSAAFEQMVNLGTTASQVIAGNSPLSNVKEFRSFATLNIAWMCVTKTLSTSATTLNQPLPKTGEVSSRVLSVLLSSVRDSFSTWAQTCDSNNSKVLRFFLQHLAKVMAANPAAIRSCWSDLAAVLAEIQVPFISHLDDSNAPRAQMLAEAKSALSKATAELSTWLFAQRDCADLLSDLMSGKGMNPRSLGHLGLILAILQTCVTAAADVRLMAVNFLLPCTFQLAGHDLPNYEAWRNVSSTILGFMMACCARRTESTTARNAWKICQNFLMECAFDVHPLRMQLLSEIWAGIIGRSTPDFARGHIEAVMCCAINAATLDDADLASQSLVSPLLGQLMYLSANLVSALPDQACFEFCHHMLQCRAWCACEALLHLCRAAHVPLPEEIIGDLSSAVATTLKHAMKLTVLPPCMLPCFSVAEILCTIQAGQLPGSVLQAAEACQRQSEVAAIVAAFAAHCDEVQPTPTKLFSAILTEQHWALQHEAMLALLAFARSPCTDLKAVLPRQLCDADDQPSASFVQLLTHYMQRTDAKESCSERHSGQAMSVQDAAHTIEANSQKGAALQCLADKACAASAKSGQQSVANAFENAWQALEHLRKAVEDNPKALKNIKPAAVGKLDTMCSMMQEIQSSLA
ncbi:hypothetical protein COCOBI_01-2740 [Coccomyxa sp. Obi]|nr:hypothetical protein COCOBI_01-2740 [Coccomyxa sp. Obi]